MKFYITNSQLKSSITKAVNIAPGDPDILENAFVSSSSLLNHFFLLEVLVPDLFRITGCCACKFLILVSTGLNFSLFIWFVFTFQDFSSSLARSSLDLKNNFWSLKLRRPVKTSAICCNSLCRPACRIWRGPWRRPCCTACCRRVLAPHCPKYWTFLKICCFLGNIACLVSCSAHGGLHPC